MKEAMEALAETIEEEIAVHEGLLRELERQEEILIQGRHADLEENLRRLEDLRWRARELQRDREVYKEKLARRMCLENERVTLHDLVGDGGGSGAELLRLRDRLVDAARRVRVRTRKNMVLIRQALAINSGLAACAAGGEPAAAETYGRTGAVRPAHRPGLVDAKV